EVFHAKVQLLRAVRAIRGNDHRVVGERAERTPVPRTERQDPHAFGARRLGGAQDVRRLATRRVNDQEVALLRQRFHLPGEDVVEREVVRGGRDERRVRGDGNGRVRGAVLHVAHHVL